MIALLVIAYLVVGFIVASVVHRYFLAADNGVSFLFMCFLWPFVLFFASLDFIKQFIEMYMKWLRKGKE